MTEPFLLSQWAVCGIAAAAARFVPVPLLDDVIRQRPLRSVVRTLRAHVDGHVIPQGWCHAMPHGVRVQKLLRGGLLGLG